MKGLIIATHGQLSIGLKDAANLITGMGDRIVALSLNREDNLDDFEKKFLETLSEYSSTGALVLVDMVGGSPYNVALKYIDSHNIHVIAGANLMMTIEVLSSLDNLSIKELSAHAKRVGRESVQNFPTTEDELITSSDEVVEDYGTGGKITFARVDHRLIHGQVITKWSKIAQADTIIIVDDALYKDEAMAGIYRSASPAGIEVIIAPSEVIAYAQANNTLPSGNVMLLFKDVEGVSKAYAEGLRLEKLQLGGIPNDGKKKMVFTAVSLSEGDVEKLDKVQEIGTKIDLQVVPEERGISYDEAKEKLN